MVADGGLVLGRHFFLGGGITFVNLAHVVSIKLLCLQSATMCDPISGVTET